MINSVSGLPPSDFKEFATAGGSSLLQVGHYIGPGGGRVVSGFRKGSRSSLGTQATSLPAPASSRRLLQDGGKLLLQHSRKIADQICEHQHGKFDPLYLSFSGW